MPCCPESSCAESPASMETVQAGFCPYHNWEYQKLPIDSSLCANSKSGKMFTVKYHKKSYAVRNATRMWTRRPLSTAQGQSGPATLIQRILSCLVHDYYYYHYYFYTLWNIELGAIECKIFHSLLKRNEHCWGGQVQRSPHCRMNLYSIRHGQCDPREIHPPDTHPPFGQSEKEKNRRGHVHFEYDQHKT